MSHNSRWWMAVGAACLVLWLPAAAVGGQNPAALHASVPTTEAVRVASAVVVDGRLDDHAWEQAIPATTFRQRDPDEGQPATEATELRIAYDDEAIYVGARLLDREPRAIVRRLSRRDSQADADRFAVYLDPHHDHLTGALFEVSAAGVQRDAIIFNDFWTDDTWDAVWTSAVTVDERGWTLEMRIPFSQLRFPAAEQPTWGINAARFLQRKNETSWLELVPKKESGLASRMAHLSGLRGIRESRHLTLLPYTVARGEFITPDSPRDPFNDGSRLFGGAGLDLKYGLTSSLTLDVAVNPDFGQVEVDPAVVNLSAFETLFEERRPFFIEGSQIFGNFGRGGSNSYYWFNNPEPMIFYSRRIGRAPQGGANGEFVDRPGASTILGAAKLTGKTARGWNLGLLEAVTGREWARVTRGDGRTRVEIEPLTSYFGGRLQRERRRGGFGLLTTAVHRSLRDPAIGDALPRRALVVGGDGYVFLDNRRDWVVTGYMAGSSLAGSPAAITRIQRSSQHYFQRPDRPRLDPSATSLAGWAGRVNMNRNNGIWRVNAGLWGVSPGFDSGDLGFSFGTASIAGAHSVLNWRKPNPDRFTRSRNIWIAKWWTWNFDRERQGDGWHVNANATLLNYWNIGGGLGIWRRVLSDSLTRGGPSMTSPGGGFGSLNMGSDSRRRVSFHLGGSYSWNEFGGWGGGGGVSLQIKPSPSLTISTGPNISRSRSLAQYVRAVTDPTAAATYGSRYVFSDLDQAQVSMGTRVNWILSPTVSLQVYAQPLLAVGDYWGFKELARPRTFEFLRYGTSGSSIAFDPSSRTYRVDPDGNGPAPSFALFEPDFNFKSLRVNAVFRWEWRPGSTMYLVWTQRREDFADPGDFSLGRDARALFGAPADSVFLVKFSYWFGR